MISPVEDLVDVLVFGDRVSPGTVTLTGHDRSWSWDVQKAKGQTGATSQLQGLDLAEFQASFYLASVEDQLAWPAFARVLESTVGGAAPKALAIWHPDLALQKITEACVTMIGGPIRDARGGVTVQVKFIQYSPPKPKPPASATAGTGTDGKAQKYEHNKAARNELNGLLTNAGKP